MMSESSSYQIKVTLNGVKPPVWRRLLVPGELALKDLHHVLQRAFGWDNDHLHQFSARGRRLPGCPSRTARRRPVIANVGHVAGHRLSAEHGES
jgi:Plasmid pRiA4b ORF-3-like protein